MEKLKALIFDVDGTMVDSERYGHLPACNDAMAQIGLDIQWDWNYFKKLIFDIPGSRNRLKSELEKREFSEGITEELLNKFEPLKKEIYIEKYLPKLKIREGIKQMLNQAIENNIRLAIVSTSYESQIKALIKAQFPEYKAKFEFILGKESGKKTFNNGFLHKKCLELMKLNAEDVIMIEDSSEGKQAALEANISTAVFYNDYTKDEDFSQASLVAKSMKEYSIYDLEKICLTK
jgi:beta-phosphoglucomutase-like phosphatase (HAD superfamily)